MAILSSLLCFDAHAGYLSFQHTHYEHPDAADEISRLKLLQQCRKRAADDEQPLRHIFDNECRTSGVVAGQVSFAQIESSMYKRRRLAMPSLPTRPDDSDTAAAGSRFSTIGASAFYRGQISVDENSTAIIFATDAQLRLLTSAHLIYMDSTFRVVPSLYYQLFTVFVPHADYSFPVFYALMPRKTKDLYVAVMRMISQLAPDFQPTQVIADFEEAPTSAVLEVFGADVVISGCWFHYAQALVKRMRKLGLTDACKSDVETSTAIIF